MLQVVLITLLLGGTTASSTGTPRVPPALSPVAEAPPAAAARDRAVAFGLLLDSPLPAAVLDDAIAVADRLRSLYGIDTGNRLADRETAARRAATVLEALVFSEDEIRGMAASLGFTLDPAVCRSACRDIRALAEVELKKRALLTVLHPLEWNLFTAPCP